MQILFACLLMLPLVVARGRSKALWVLFVLPVLLLCSADLLAGRLLPGWSDWQRILLIAVPVGVALVLGFPLLVRLALPTAPLADGSLHDGLLSLAGQWQFVPDRILIWNTGGRTANAAVCGVLRPWRYVFLSDELIRRLSPRQLDAVFAHEIGHALAQHLLWRMAVMAAPLVAILAYCQITPDFVGNAARFWTVTLVLPALAAVYAATVLSYCARRCEHEADLIAAGLLASGGDGQPGANQAAYEQMIDSLSALSETNPAQVGRTTWLHPCIAARIALLRRAARSPETRQAYLLRQRRLKQCIAVGYALAAVGLLAFQLG